MLVNEEKKAAIKLEKEEPKEELKEVKEEPQVKEVKAEVKTQVNRGFTAKWVEKIRYIVFLVLQIFPALYVFENFFFNQNNWKYKRELSSSGQR